MKTKFLLFFLILFSFNTIQAEENNIIVTRLDRKGDYVKDRRSLIIEPTATIDGNTLRIYTDVVINQVAVTIKDQTNNIVYSNSNIESSRCHIFNVNGIQEDYYLLEIEIGDTFYYGYFLY